MAQGQPAPQTPYTSVPRTRQVRRIERRLNTDWQYLAEQELPQYATNDEQFNATYKQRGLRPQGTDERPVPKAANDPSYLADASTSTPRQTSFENTPKTLPGKEPEVSVAEKLLARTRVTANNVSILAWGATLWLSVQLPLALLSLVMLGLTSVVQAAATSGGFASVAIWLADRASSLLAGVLGFETSILAAADGFFLATYLLVLAIGVCSLFAAYFQYTLSLLRPLSGEMAELKLGVLIVAVFGYSVPLLNLFPWILLWMVVVWKYPK